MLFFNQKKQEQAYLTQHQRKSKWKKWWELLVVRIKISSVLKAYLTKKCMKYVLMHQFLIPKCKQDHNFFDQMLANAVNTTLSYERAAMLDNFLSNKFVE